jgi:hypothetical protein
MAARKGSLLEKQVADIFSSAGFDAETNEYVAGYETDVHAFLGDIEVVGECKQYENSRLSVKNLIHQWAGKNDAIDADKIILVIYGQDITDEEENLADQHDMVIWDEEKIADLIGMEKEAIKKEVLDSISLEEEDLGTKYEDEIRKLVWQPYLANKTENTDTSHEKLLRMVKRRIRRKLFQRGTTKAERRKHISFFEQVSTDGRVRSNVSVSRASKKFDILQSRLADQEDPFDEEKTEAYKSYLDSVKDAYEDAKSHYGNTGKKKQLRRLIDARVRDVYRHGSTARLADLTDRQPINIDKDGSKLSISFDLADNGHLEIIRWILMKEGEHETKEITNEDGKVIDRRTNVFFEYKEPDACAEAVYRVFDEYHNYELDDLRLVDLTLLTKELPWWQKLLKKLGRYLRHQLSS